VEANDIWAPRLKAIGRRARLRVALARGPPVGSDDGDRTTHAHYTCWKRGGRRAGAPGWVATGPRERACRGPNESTGRLGQGGVA
jgi:hypothetical protein